MRTAVHYFSRVALCVALLILTVHASIHLACMYTAYRQSNSEPTLQFSSEPPLELFVEVPAHMKYQYSFDSAGMVVTLHRCDVRMRVKTLTASPRLARSVGKDLHDSVVMNH